MMQLRSMEGGRGGPEGTSAELIRAEILKTMMMMRRCTRVLQRETAITKMFDQLETSLNTYCVEGRRSNVDHT